MSGEQDILDTIDAEIARLLDKAEKLKAARALIAGRDALPHGGAAKTARGRPKRLALPAPAKPGPAKPARPAECTSTFALRGHNLAVTEHQRIALSLLDEAGKEFVSGEALAAAIDGSTTDMQRCLRECRDLLAPKGLAIEGRRGGGGGFRIVRSTS